MLQFEQYLNDFNSTISIPGFVLNLFIVAILAYIIKLFYIRFGTAVSDRRKFSNNFIPLAIASMLIITVIKSSIALSLGLVGALSIVRFRAAIKDPEELTFLFLIIGLGLIGGANKPILAVFSFVLILPILYFNSKISTKDNFKYGNAFLNLNITGASIEEVTNIIKPYTGHLELKRFDTKGVQNQLSYYCRISDTKALEAIKKELVAIDQNADINFVDQPNLLL